MVNSVWLTATTPIGGTQSQPNDTEPTTYLQPAGEPTDLALAKVTEWAAWR